jgi:IclR family transcriptional regulator, KDG regulon repressor
MSGLKNSSYLKVVGKTFDVIQTMARAGPGVRLTDLSRELKQPKATTFRILYTLTRLGYVRQHPQAETYQLTEKISWGIRDNFRETLKQACRPILHQLLVRFEQTVCLGLLEHGEVFYLEIFEGIRTIRMAAAPNTYAPIHATALGKSILAFLDAGEAERMLMNRPLTKYTENTITSADGLLKKLNRIRKQGFAIDDEEAEKGARCVAAPIFNSERKPFAAVSISGPTSHIHGTHINEMGLTLKQSTRQISGRFGYKP